MLKNKDFFLLNLTSLEDLGAATCKSFGSPLEVLWKSFRSPLEVPQSKNFKV